MGLGLGSILTQAEAEFNATGRPARVFKDFRYRNSWIGGRVSARPPANPHEMGARALYEDFYCARGTLKEPVGSVRRKRGNDARQSTPAIYPPPKCTPCVVGLALSVRRLRLEAPQDRRPGPPHGPPRLDLHVGSLSLQRGLRCRRSKPPGHSSALLRSVPIRWGIYHGDRHPHRKLSLRSVLLHKSLAGGGLSLTGRGCKHEE